MIPALLPLLKDTNSCHTHLVIFSVNIIQNFMDYSNPTVTLFKDIEGLYSTIKRLQFEVTSVVELSVERNIAPSTYNDDKGQIPYS